MHGLELQYIQTRTVRTTWSDGTPAGYALNIMHAFPSSLTNNSIHVYLLNFTTCVRSQSDIHRLCLPRTSPPVYVHRATFTDFVCHELRLRTSRSGELICVYRTDGLLLLVFFSCRYTFPRHCSTHPLAQELYMPSRLVCKALTRGDILADAPANCYPWGRVLASPVEVEVKSPPLSCMYIIYYH